MHGAASVVASTYSLHVDVCEEAACVPLNLCCGLAALAVQCPWRCGSLRPAPIHRSGSVDPIVSCVTTRRAANKGRLAPSLNIAAN